jgi:hypothetical protein
MRVGVIQKRAIAAFPPIAEASESHTTGFKPTQVCRAMGPILAARLFYYSMACRHLAHSVDVGTDVQDIRQHRVMCRRFREKPSM